MITITMPIMDLVRFKFMFTMCLVLQVVCGKQEMKCIEREGEALLQFKAALVDRYGMLSSWTTADCCQWEGIRCSNLTGHILMLDLHGEFHYHEYVGRLYGIATKRYITGEIHKSLMELRQLKYLNLSFNSFIDRGIPDFLGSLTNLRYLDLGACHVGGKIPTQFWSLFHLKYLNLTGNDLWGSIPPQLGNLSKLQYLDLGSNSFEGNIPSKLGSLSKLQYLDLSLNYFEGNIPFQLGNLSNLQHLDLRGISFQGNIPYQLGNLSNLQKLYLGGYPGALKIVDGGRWLSNLISLTDLYLLSISNLTSSNSWQQMIATLPKLRELRLIDCGLSDHFILSFRPSKFNFSNSLSVFYLSQNTFTSPMIFEWVSNITSNLVELNLAGNLLEGSPSNHFGMVMNSLEHIDISLNRFKGDVLKSFMNICTLHSLGMFANNLTEDLPSILHNFSRGCVRYSLQELDLEFNRITGSLTDLSVFSSLKALLLDENQLSGKIPDGIRLPSKLELLSIGSNSIEGGVPKSFGNTCSLNVLDLSRNNLSEELTVIFNHLSGCSRYSLRELNLGQNKINAIQVPDFSMFPSLKRLDLGTNKLNETISDEVQFPTELEELYLSSNSLKGVITDYHFANMSKLKSLKLSDNSLTLAFTQNWVPSFQLDNVGLRSCKLGPSFPKWLETQHYLNRLDISNAGISDVVHRFPNGWRHSIT